jgi:hypothetical protein
MPRKITSGVVGGPVLGSISSKTNTFESVETNANIVFTPDGTGVTEFTKDILISGNNGVRLQDGDTDYVALKAPASIGTSYTLTFPGDNGASNQALTTDGSGVLSWISPALAVTDRSAADGSTYYVAMADSTSGTEDTLSVASGRLEFVPNPGRLSAAEIRSTASTTSSSTSTGSLVVTGGVGIGGQLTAVTIVETSSIALKENIEPITNGLESILQLKGVTYDRLDNQEHESGLIAEWTENVLPDLVTRDDGNNVVGIKYTKLTAYLIEAVKTLKAEIDELKGS